MVLQKIPLNTTKLNRLIHSIGSKNIWDRKKESLTRCQQSVHEAIWLNYALIYTKIPLPFLYICIVLHSKAFFMEELKIHTTITQLPSCIAKALLAVIPFQWISCTNLKVLWSEKYFSVYNTHCFCFLWQYEIVYILHFKRAVLAAYVFITLKYVPAPLSRCKGRYLEANTFGMVG